MKTFDLHFSGYKVEQALIEFLLAMGFQRDLFTNNKRCSTTQFHATYKGDRQIDSLLFEGICSTMKAFPDTVADLELESSDSSLKAFFQPINLNQGTLPAEFVLEPFKFRVCPPEIIKACDIHLSIDVMRSSAYALHVLEEMQMVSFDRPTEDGFKRIYTLTYEDRAEAERMSEKLKILLGKLHGFSGKLKLEYLESQFKMPANAPVLPLVEL